MLGPTYLDEWNPYTDKNMVMRHDLVCYVNWHSARYSWDILHRSYNHLIDINNVNICISMQCNGGGGGGGGVGGGGGGGGMCVFVCAQLIKQTE